MTAGIFEGTRIASDKHTTLTASNLMPARHGHGATMQDIDASCLCGLAHSESEGCYCRHCARIKSAEDEDTVTFVGRRLRQILKDNNRSSRHVEERSAARTNAAQDKRCLSHVSSHHIPSFVPYETDSTDSHPTEDTINLPTTSDILPINTNIAAGSTAVMVSIVDEPLHAQVSQNTHDNMMPWAKWVGNLSDVTESDSLWHDAIDSEDVMQTNSERLFDFRLDDETIARLLSKQEQLGMGSAHLMLFDDNTVKDTKQADAPALSHSEVDTDDSPDDSAKSVSHARRGITDVRNGSIGHYHASQDLRSCKSGRRKVPDFDISDSELEEALDMQWLKDRSRKAIKKAEREALRAQGLIGRPSKKHKQRSNVQSKQDHGVDTVERAIHSFMMSDAQEKALVPMDAKARKTVHMKCHTLGLKTRSRGHGSMRYPVIYRTSRTPAFDSTVLSHMDGGLSMTYSSSRRSGGPGLTSRKQRGTVGAVSYRDGEIVGQCAPELGTENKGRAMLEKMGWSTGTPLGISKNQGIQTPVMQVVKTTKAGLG